MSWKVINGYRLNKYQSSNRTMRNCCVLTRRQQHNYDRMFKFKNINNFHHPEKLFNLPILCTYLDGIEFSLQHANVADELKHHLRFMYKKNTNIKVTTPNSAPSIVVLSIFAVASNHGPTIQMKNREKIIEREKTNTCWLILLLLLYCFVIFILYIIKWLLNINDESWQIN